MSAAVIADAGARFGIACRTALASLLPSKSVSTTGECFSLIALYWFVMGGLGGPDIGRAVTARRWACQ
jgi:hypothetical protein